VKEMNSFPTKKESKVIGPQDTNEEVKISDIERSVIIKWFQSRDKHEASWDFENSRYSLELEEVFLKSLTDEERKTVISLFILEFGEEEGKLHDLFEDILGEKFQWPVTTATRENKPTESSNTATKGRWEHIPLNDQFGDSRVVEQYFVDCAIGAQLWQHEDYSYSLTLFDDPTRLNGSEHLGSYEYLKKLAEDTFNKK
jgi:hypothetical protein